MRLVGEKPSRNAAFKEMKCCAKVLQLKQLSFLEDIADYHVLRFERIHPLGW